MSVLPFGEWLPDRPDLAEGTKYASGVVATTQDSYGPLRSLAPFSTNGLNSTCLGMAAMEDINEDVQIFAGTGSKLYHLPYGTALWVDVSGTTYAPATGEYWRIAQFNEIVLATDFTDPIQSYTMGSSSAFANLASAAPKARHIAVAKTFAIVANTSDPVGGNNPARIWWSASNDPTNWPTPGSTTAQQNQSDYSDLLGPQGAITGLVPSLAGCDCAVFFERGVFRMIYVGPPDVFDFYPAAAVKGCSASNSLVALGSYVYGLLEDGFYVFDGNSAVPIGANKIDKWFFQNANLSNLSSVIGAADIGNKAIVWLFQSNQAVTTQPDTALIYRWDIRRWTWAPMAAQWLARIPVPVAGGGFPPTETPLVAGQLQLGAIDGSNRLAYFSGPYLAAQVGTRALQITPGSKSFVQSARPLIDGGINSQYLLTETGQNILTESGSPLIIDSYSPIITVAMTARDTYQESENLGVFVPTDIMGECPQRVDGRFHRAVANIASGNWTTAYGVDLTAVRSGWR